MKKVLLIAFAIAVLGGYCYLSFKTIQGKTIEGTRLQIISVDRIIIEGNDLIIRSNRGEILVLHKDILKDISIEESSRFKKVSLVVIPGKSKLLPIMTSEFVWVRESFGPIDNTIKRSIYKIKLLGFTIKKGRDIEKLEKGDDR